METWRPWLLVMAVSLPLTLFGSLIGGWMGAAAALGLFVAMSLFLFRYSDRLVLQVARAKPLTKETVPQLFSVTRSLSTWAELPMPGLYAIDMVQPNAFVVARSEREAAIVVTTGLLKGLDPDELRGVMALKLAHIKHGDYRWSSFAAAMAAAAVLLRDGLKDLLAPNRSKQRREQESASLAVCFTPLLHLSSTGRQELRADRTAVRIAGTAEGLVRALHKAEASVTRWRIESRYLPLFVANPLIGLRLMNRRTARPNAQERIARLRANA